MMKAPIELKLHDIAAWTPGIIPKDIPKEQCSHDCHAGIPSLQRGAVWEPRQVELLWDSLLRGFPIGSFVVCLPLENQSTRSGKNANGEQTKDPPSHHLLDGQQRADAIALGFDDPFKEDRKTPPKQILWLDLNPKPPALNATNSRTFWFRVTTEAHPWGYGRNDAASCLGIGRIRESLEKCGWQRGEERPKPTRCWPIEAEVPIPFAWLVNLIWWSDLSSEEIVRKLSEDCEAHRKSANFPGRSWLDSVSEYMASGLDRTKTLAKIIVRVKELKRVVILALEVPKDVIENDTETSEKNSSVEHLFQRLNSAGTELKGEELAYSLIKFYWPEVEESLRELAAKRMPDSRLARLTAQVALTSADRDGKTIISGPLTIGALRNIASQKDDKNKKDCADILAFFNADQTVDRTADLQRVLKRIEDWCGDQVDDGLGLPAVLLSSIARNSPDVYLLLMLLARHCLTQPTSDRTAQILLRKRVLGMATTLRWFGVDNAQAVKNISARIFNKPGNMQCEAFAGILSPIKDEKDMVFNVLSPTELKKEIPEPCDTSGLSEWTWENLFRQYPWRKHPGDVVQDKYQKVRPMIDRIVGNRELLIYAQRAYMRKKFGDYDPARQDMWKDHDRPWDYDHILPSARVGGKWYVRKAIKSWANCIANLRALPFEENRYDQDKTPMEKIPDDALSDSFLTKEERKDFTSGCDHGSSTSGEENSLLFVKASRLRLIRIYEAWYDALDIGYLFQRTNDEDREAPLGILNLSNEYSQPTTN